MNTTHAVHPPTTADAIARPVTLLTGDATDLLRTLPDETVDCVVTSPPYWRLRDYATGAWTGGTPDCPHPPAAHTETDGQRRCGQCAATWNDHQYGLEPTLTDYIDHLRQVFTELHRVLSATGTAWLTLGDSYAANSDGYHTSSPLQYRQPRYRPRADLPHKNLIGIPWRAALALQADGWLIRNAVVWHKPNAAPFPVHDRLTPRYETVFLLAKQPHHYFDRAISSVPASEVAALPASASSRPPADLDIPPGDQCGDVWHIPVTPRRHQRHPATFPLAIPLHCIRLGSPPGALVCDPFSGIGTTGIAALALGRAYLGIELNPAFTQIATDRLGHHQGPRAGHRETGGHHGEAP